MNTIKTLIAVFKKMVTDLAKPGQAIVDSLTAAKAHCLHMAIGLVGEVAGELPVTNSHENLVEELGDVEFYFEGLLQAYEITALPETPEGIDSRLLRLPAMLCLVVMAGEIMDIVKKHVIYDKPVNREKLINYMAAFRNTLDALEAGRGEEISREIVLQANVNKLLKGTADKKARYAEGSYSDDQADRRADKET